MTTRKKEKKEVRHVSRLRSIRTDIKYSMCDVTCDVVWVVTVLEVAMWAK